MTDEMFTRLPQPLAYAETLMGWFCRLGRGADENTLADLCVAGVAQLSQCEFCQLYRLDKATGRLELIAQHLQGDWTASDPASGQRAQEEQLLQYVLTQGQAITLDDLNRCVYDCGFLPEATTPWRSLCGIPLCCPGDTVSGVLLCASQRPLALQGYVASLAQLGSFALGQLARASRTPPDVTGLKSGASLVGAFGLIGGSTAMEATCRLISKVLRTPFTVLLRGETGTGKEVVARAIHAAGQRSHKAFVVQNCAAFPEGLLESELFGYRKGAFTGALRDYAGLFDAADGGTLLLDEIGDMPLSLQAKLLRVLQEGEIRPLGANASHKVDVRIIAATHRDLAAMVANGSFREDLYYRLAQFPIELPALRDRDGDMPQLARHFADKACVALGRGPVGWSSEALDQLTSHDFPGNVRELKCLVERAVLMCDEDVILPVHLALSPSPVTVVDTTLRQRLERVERTVLIDCLHRNRGNRTRTARELGVARRTLLYRLARLNIPCGEAKGEC